jgi:hypothetical protein
MSEANFFIDAVCINPLFANRTINFVDSSRVEFPSQGRTTKVILQGWGRVLSLTQIDLFGIEARKNRRP